MKNLILFLILGTALVYTTNAFLFSKKFVDGCNPDPCKHKSKCVLNAKDKKLYNCTCTEGFHGQNCELKTGCSAKPCRKGKCMDNKKDLSDFICTCDAGFVGKKCDTADACAKSPCKNTAKCSLDAKLKPVCECPEGWGSKNCDKRNCTITEFKSKVFTKGTGKVYIDHAIESKLKEVEGLANLCKVKLHILKSFVLNPDSKAVALDLKDKTNPHFYTGQALAFHVYDQTDKLLCNDVCLGKIPIPQPAAKCFIDGLHAIKLKWSVLDPTVFSTGGSHVIDTKAYNSLRAHHQVGCREKKF